MPETRPNPEVPFQAMYDADSAVMKLRQRRPNASDADVTRAAVNAAYPPIRQQVLEELLSNEVVDAVHASRYGQRARHSIRRDLRVAILRLDFASSLGASVRIERRSDGRPPTE